jgi:hypothetical protein
MLADPFTPTARSLPSSPGEQFVSMQIEVTTKEPPLNVYVTVALCPPTVSVSVVALARGAAQINNVTTTKARIESLRLVFRTTLLPSGI